MKTLLLVAHGSRRMASNDEIRNLTEKLRKKITLQGDTDVRCAFLEQAQPSIPEAIDECIENGSRAIVVLPYFLSAGRHVSVDIPELIKNSQSRYPYVSITLRPHIGASDAMTDLLMSMALGPRQT